MKQTKYEDLVSETEAKKDKGLNRTSQILGMKTSQFLRIQTHQSSSNFLSA